MKSILENCHQLLRTRAYSDAAILSPHAYTKSIQSDNTGPGAYVELWVRLILAKVMGPRLALLLVIYSRYNNLMQL